LLHDANNPVLCGPAGVHELKPHIVLTRPVEQSRRFAEALTDALGGAVEVVVSPLMQINPLEFGPVRPERDVIFTSENGVAGFVAGAEVRGRKAFCVGDRTAEAAREAGFEAYSASGTSVDLIELIASEGGGEMIYARGAHIARDLKTDLAAIGIPVEEVLVYGQDPLALGDDVRSLLCGSGPVVFPLFSRRSMRLLVEQGVGESAALVRAVCISKSVAGEVPSGVFEVVDICDAPNSRSMIESLRLVIA
jgi:uroporphyrinogen-III synthase